MSKNLVILTLFAKICIETACNKVLENQHLPGTKATYMRILGQRIRNIYAFWWIMQPRHGCSFVNKATKAFSMTKATRTADYPANESGERSAIFTPWQSTNRKWRELELKYLVSTQNCLCPGENCIFLSHFVQKWQGIEEDGSGQIMILMLSLNVIFSDWMSLQCCARTQNEALLNANKMDMKLVKFQWFTISILMNTIFRETLKLACSATGAQ